MTFNYRLPHLLLLAIQISGRSRRGFPLIFRPNWSLKGQKNFFETVPPISRFGWPPPLPPPLSEGLDRLLQLNFSPLLNFQRDVLWLIKLKEIENLNYMELIQGCSLAVPGPPAKLSLLLGEWEISVFARKSHTGILDFTGSEHCATL